MVQSISPFDYRDDWRLDLGGVLLGGGAGYAMAGDVIDLMGVQNDLWAGIVGLAYIGMAIMVSRDTLYLLVGHRVEEQGEE